MSKFSRFNAVRYFDIDGLVFRTTKNEKGETVNVYMNPEELYEEKGTDPCVVAGIYKKSFSQRTLEENPTLPPYRYTLAVKLYESEIDGDEYVYVNTPLTMNDSFDAIMADNYLIKEVQKGNCVIQAYTFTKGDQERYGLKFVD